MPTEAAPDHHTEIAANRTAEAAERTKETALRAGRRSGTALPRKPPRAPWDLNAVFARSPLGLALLNSLAMMSIGQASSPAKNMTAPTAVRGKFAVDSPLEERVSSEPVSEIGSDSGVIMGDSGS